MNQFWLPTDDDSGGGYMSMNALEDMQDGKYVHPSINARYYRLKIRDRIRLA